jgi:hypothetical protein
MPMKAFGNAHDCIRPKAELSMNRPPKHRGELFLEISKHLAKLFTISRDVIDIEVGHGWWSCSFRFVR